MGKILPGSTRSVAIFSFETDGPMKGLAKAAVDIVVKATQA
jgi:hypothetical protein